MIERERKKVYSIPIWLFIHLYALFFYYIIYTYITYLLIIVGTDLSCVCMYLVYCTVCWAHVTSTSPSTLTFPIN